MYNPIGFQGSHFCDRKPVVARPPEGRAPLAQPHRPQRPARQVRRAATARQPGRASTVNDDTYKDASVNLYIISWNVQGKFTLVQLLDRFVENSWSLLVVLEPSATIPTDYQQVKAHASEKLVHFHIGVLIVNVGDQNIVVIYRTDQILTLNGNKVDVVGGERGAIYLEVTTVEKVAYKILTAHAPYRNNSGIAGIYQSKLLQLAEKLGVDIILGDLNTYGKAISSRSGFELISGDVATSQGGHPLDKVIMKSTYYGAHISSGSFELDEIEIPDESFFPMGSRASGRQSVQQSRMGRGKKSDYLPVFLSVPSISTHKPGDGGQLSGSAVPRPESITGDGNFLYRCVAKQVYGDQSFHARVRRELVEYVRQNYANYNNVAPFLMDSMNRLNYLAWLGTDATWGGELEILMLAHRYNLTIRLYSPQGFADALYGNGAAAMQMFHNGRHFYC